MSCVRMSKYWLPWLVGMPAETATAVCCLLMGGVLHRFPRLKVLKAEIDSFHRCQNSGLLRPWRWSLPLHSGQGAARIQGGRIT